MVQSLIDVTQSTYAAKTALERSNAVWGNFPACEFDPEGHVTAINALMAEALGYDADECIGKHDSSFCAREFARGLPYKQTWKALLEGKTQKLLVCQRTKDQKTVWLQSTFLPIKDVEFHPEVTHLGA